MPDQPLQNSLFEDDYLLREFGQVTHLPQVALTELVANAGDAGATRVDLILPGEIGGSLTVTDNGHGMTPAHFKKRWLTLRLGRLKRPKGPAAQGEAGAGATRKAHLQVRVERERQVRRNARQSMAGPLKPRSTKGKRVPEPVVNQRLTTAADETDPRMAGSGWKEL